VFSKSDGSNVKVYQFTLRAVLTGMTLGGVLSLCNIYSGLKIGWGFNMSVTAALISYAFWQSSNKIFKTREWGLLENNINQTIASSAAAISSAGLVSAVPALTMITGQTLSWFWLSIWVFSVAVVGVTVAIGLRRQMLIVDKLKFPGGVASATTIKEMYAKGSEAIARIKVLLSAAVFSSSLRITRTLFSIPKAPVPGLISSQPDGALISQGIAGITLKNMTFAFEPSMMMVGVGALIGWRACVSLLGGAIVAWGIIGPRVLELGWADPGINAADASWYTTVLRWLLWPGVAMMVTSSLTSFAFSWRSILTAITGKDFTKNLKKQVEENEVSDDTYGQEDDVVPRKVFKIALLFVLILSVVLQVFLFGIQAWAATFGVLITFILAIVAGRVSGETGVTPVGAMGKVTQLIFGTIDPSPAANLMSANVTGGAASQCADLLHDLKCGQILGASPRLQCYAQYFGTIAGALVGSAAYLVLIPDPKNQLLTDEWPAPAVATWKAVAEVFMIGFEAMPEGAVTAMMVAGTIGIILAALVKVIPAKYAYLVPSPASIGLAFVIPAYNSISMFIGGFIGLVLTKYCKTWAEKFLVVAAAGLIAGESLTGVAQAMLIMIFPS
jgi:OPT family oligopeptide transporter